MIYYLSNRIFVPNPLDSTEDGLLAVGGDLSTERLLAFYERGIFPWFNQDQPILWWFPPYRPVFKTGEIKISKSFKQTIRSRKFTVSFDEKFDEVLNNCANLDFRSDNDTWLSEDIKKAFSKLHNLGYAHSVEVYFKGEMVGGLYGLSLGGAFIGESMFYKMSDASKFALFALSENLKDWGFDFIDGQYVNQHLLSMGAEIVEGKDFLKMMKESLEKETKKGKWKNEIEDFGVRV